MTINLYDFNLTAGYGIGVETTSTPWTPTGPSLALPFGWHAPKFAILLQ